MEVDVSGAGGHVARTEREIRIIRERVRCHVAYYLPFTLSTVGIAMLVLYCISRLNYEPAGLREWGPSPREAYIGRKPDGKRDFRCSFGDYVQCTVPNTDSGFKSRTEDCVVMLPLGNRTGSVRMLSLSTGRLVNRDQLRVLPMPESVIKRLNELAQADGRVKGKGDLYARPTSYGDATKGLPDTIEPIVNNGMDPSVEPLVGRDNHELINVDGYDGELHQDGGGEPEVQQYDSGGASDEPDPNDDIELYEEDKPDIRTNECDNDMDDLVDSMNKMQAGPRGPVGDPEGRLDERGVPESYTSAGEIRYEYSDARDSVSRATELLAAPAPRCSVSRHEVMNFFRNGSGTALLTRDYDGDGADWGDYVLNLSVNEALRTRGDAALSVIEKELKQMIDKKVWGPVDVNGLSGEEKHRIFRSSMFLKEKFLASGEFEELKARLVAGRNQQDCDLYNDLSAPTVATSSVFTLLSIAEHENRTITVIDISWAFLNSDTDTGLVWSYRVYQAYGPYRTSSRSTRSFRLQYTYIPSTTS